MGARLGMCYNNCAVGLRSLWKMVDEEWRCLFGQVSVRLSRRSNKGLSLLAIALALVVVGTVGFLFYVVANPPAAEGFSEFYMLGPEGQTSGYPTELAVGQEGRVILGITNREHKPVSYSVELLVAGEMVGEVASTHLADGETWEGEVVFVPQEPGADQRIEFRLCKVQQLGDAERGQTLLCLWLGGDELSATVTNQSESEHAYELQAEVVDTGGDQERRTESVGPLPIAPGEQSRQGLSCNGREAECHISKFLLYGDGELLYDEKASSPYPAVHLSVDVE